MYEEFADVYDRLMDDFDYAAWARYYRALIRQGDAPVAAIVELGCGTGAMSVEFAKLGMRVTGIDNSTAMLQKAAIRARGAGVPLPLVRQDMRAFQVHTPMDAIVAPCDGVNYLLDGESVRACFESVFRALRPGGAFAFDISTEAKLEEMCGALFYEDRADVTYFWENRKTDRIVDMTLTFFVRQPGGGYKRFDERQKQRMHRAEELTRALTDAGFGDIAVYGDRVFAPPAPDEKRVHIRAIKPNV